MDLEKVPSIGRVITETEKKFNAEEVREEITKLRDDAKEKYKNCEVIFTHYLNIFWIIDNLLN